MREELIPTVRPGRTALLYLPRFHQHCNFTACVKPPDLSHGEGFAFVFHPYDPWYQDMWSAKLKVSASLCQMCPHNRSLSLGLPVERRSPGKILLQPWASLTEER